MAWVISDAPKDLKPAEMLVALVLANHASSDGGHAYPSVQTLMDETRLSRRSVQTALRSLEDRGVIEEEREATRRLPAMYAFPVFRGANSAPHNQTGAQPVYSGAQILHVRGAEFAPKPLVEPLVEPLDTPPVVPLKKKRATQIAADWDEHQQFQGPDGLYEWARRELGMNVQKVDAETDKFLDYWRGEGATKVDWVATWRNWMRRSQEGFRRRA